MRYRVFLFLLIFGWIVLIISAQTTCTGAPRSRLLVGEQAQVIAVGGSNLRVRPSSGAILLNVIPEGEIIPVMDGPFCEGEYAWWQVDYAGERGWVAEGTGEFYWLAPYVIQRAQIGTVRIEIQPNLVTDIRIERLADPLRSQFILEGYPVQSNQLVPFIVIFDEVPDELEIPMGNVIAQPENLELGMRFIDIFFTEPIHTADEITLIYHYMAVTEDNRFIDAYFPVAAPNLPLTYQATETDIEGYNSQYFEDSIASFDALSDEDFTPTLSQLDGLVRSLQMNAPIEESDLLQFDSSGIHFDYNPSLATGISEALITENSIPRHIRLTFDNYPIAEAVIRIYHTEDISGNSLATLQQILSRQPANPPMIPIPSQTDPPLVRDDIRYLNFGNGEGIRYRVSFIENEFFYSYQGLSNSGDYFVSALVPIQDDYPPLSLLDALIQSLQIGE